MGDILKTDVSYCTSAANTTCNYNVGSINFYTRDVEYTGYGYIPTEWIAIVFVVFFALFSLTHFGLAVWSRQWWLIYTVVFGAIGETIGWGGRLWSASSATWYPDTGGFWHMNTTAFLMQISVLIFSPAFLQAGNYILLGRIIPILGAEYTFIHPLSYTIIFVFGDLVSLIVQAIGGGKAASSHTLEEANNGGYVMVGGVMFQMVIMIAYTIVLLSFVWRRKVQKPFVKQREFFTWWPNALRPKSMKKDSNKVLLSSTQPRTDSGLSSTASRTGTLVGTPQNEMESMGLPGAGEKIKKRSAGFGAAGKMEDGSNGATWVPTAKEVRGAEVMLFVCMVSTLFIFVRSVFRCVELLEGWRGPIIENQELFNYLDGMMIAFAIATILLFHPGVFMPRRDRARA